MPQFDREFRQGGSSPAHTLPPMAAPGKQVQDPQGAGPRPDLDPGAVQVDQYAQGTDLDRFNDCGPACVLMIVRAMGQEQALTALVAAQLAIEPAQVTLQQRMTYIRGKTGGTSDAALSFAQVKAILVAVLRDLKITLTDKELAKQLSFISDAGALTTNSDQPPSPTSPTRIQEYLAEHCGNGSAVIALGRPTKDAWGWGGTDDANHRTVAGKDGPVAQSIGDTGNHFVVVWAAQPGVFTVLDPSWSAPRAGETLAQVVAFLAAKGGNTPVDLMAVPFADLAAHVPAAAPALAPAHAAQRKERGFGVDLATQRVVDKGGKGEKQSDRHPSFSGKRTMDAPSTPAPGPIAAAQLQAVIDAHAGAARTTAAKALWTWCAANIPGPDLHAYEQSPVDNGKKQATIGLVAARRARLEFLLGWLVEGGLHATGSGWEDAAGTSAEAVGGDESSNAGSVVSEYTGYRGRYGLPNHDWCGMFVGFNLAEAGMPVGVTTAHPQTDHTELASAPRAVAWITDKARKRGTGEQIITPAQLADGSAVPAPGDVIVYAEHVAMVEAYDAATKTISTVDGNVQVFAHEWSNGVGGAETDPTSIATLHGGLQLLWRPGLESFGATANAPGAAASADNSAGDAVVAKIEGACQQVSALYQAMQLPGANAVDGGKTVAAMSNDASGVAS